MPYKQTLNTVMMRHTCLPDLKPLYSVLSCSLDTIKLLMLPVILFWFAGVASLQAQLAPTTSAAVGTQRLHAVSLVKPPKYEPGFKHFEYVNPKAPKGGTARMSSIGTFDNFNIFVYKGNPANGLGLIYDTLMDSSLDEPSTIYSNLAEWIEMANDLSYVSFKIRPQARWHDGKPITPEDVIFSFHTFKKNHPFYAQYYKNIIRAEKSGPHIITFHFDVKNNRELPQIVASLPVLPRHYWKGTGKNGKPRDPSKTTLEPPLGSGPYKIKSYVPGQSVVYERVKNHWGRNLPVNVGKYNFDRVSFEYFKDGNIAFQAFKGGQYDYREENNSKIWATQYKFPAVKSGKITKTTITLQNGQPMQGFIFNTRKSLFADPRVRQAFNFAFDFEWSNKNLFYGQYKRTSSYFENTELAARELPTGQELKYLEELRDQIPPEVFTTIYTNPENGTRDALRKNLRQARKLLAKAGWKVSREPDQTIQCGFFCKIMTSIGLKSQKTKPVLRNAKGQPFKTQFLLVSPAFERIVLPVIKNLERLGIQASIRIVDAAQYTRRRDKFDYDIIIGSWSQSQSPGNEQRDYWHSTTASTQGSRNLAGIKDPAIDKLIDRIIFAKDRADLVAATRALDRVLLWNHFVVPQWHVPYERVAYWNRFSHPKTMPRLSTGFPSIWWFDEKKAAKINN